MKTCILLHGHMRTYKKTYDSLRNYIDDFENIDIFIHTWDTLDRVTPSYYENSSSSNICIEHITELYKPIDILVEKQVFNNPDITCPYNKISLEGHKYYFESLYKVNLLKMKYETKHNFKYDIVIKLRPDIILKSKLRLNMLNYNTIYLIGNPINNNADLHSIGNFRALNVITISNSNNMDKITNFYKHIDTYIYVKLHKHSDYIDYIIDLGLDLEILNYFYNKDWGFIRL